MSGNPYTLSFGKEPLQNISRDAQMMDIISDFADVTPSNQMYMITGVRGSGKTVFMSELSNYFSGNDDWIVVELNPERNLLETLAAKLSSNSILSGMFKASKINLSLFGFGLEVSGEPPIADIEVALSRMLQSMKNNGKRLLITIDEVSSTKYMREFVSVFQIFIRKDLPIFLIMTGLYENIDKLQNEKSLTFLYRAPKITLNPLNLRTMANNYRDNLNITDEEALNLARLTKGYSFAFQVFGSFTYKLGALSDEAMDRSRQYLEDYAYDKIWAEMSAGDHRLAYGIAKSGNGKISKIKEILHIDQNELNPYRKRLIKKGIVSGDLHGYITFTLPLFDNFVLDNYIE